MNKELTDIGFILKPHGYKGDMRIRIHGQVSILDAAPRAFFLQVGAEFIPYFTESYRPTGDSEALIHLEGIQSKEEAARLKGQALFLPSASIQWTEPVIESDPYIGCMAEDLQFGEIGVVDEVLSYPQQELLSIHRDGRQILIPLRPEFIHKLELDQKRILFDLPEGLLDI
jgi:16S rRNA processing protein RimM